jgi:hypothetical protein
MSDLIIGVISLCFIIIYMLVIMGVESYHSGYMKGTKNCKEIFNRKKEKQNENRGRGIH